MSHSKFQCHIQNLIASRLSHGVMSVTLKTSWCHTGHMVLNQSQLKPHIIISCPIHHTQNLCQLDYTKKIYVNSTFT